MNVIVTGANGFIGKNLCLRLSELRNYSVIPITRESSSTKVFDALIEADFIFHLAGANRPKDQSDFFTCNQVFTQHICESLLSLEKKIPIVLTSSIQALLDNPYGQSKKAAEDSVLAYSDKSGANTFIYRLPNVFGKWCKPNYNSVVATFCYNISRDIPISVNDPNSLLQLVYIDDVVNTFISLLQTNESASGFQSVGTSYQTTLGELISTLKTFKDSRISLIIDHVGVGFKRALYSTYISYLPTSAFSYKLSKYSDDRGVFVEMIKTLDSGQFSFFTAYPGITRGEHYHHSKTEKFLVIKGKAHFSFRNVSSGETFELFASGTEPEVIETVPGWTHNIKNIGDEEMIVMLWANEIFDRDLPDTIHQKVSQ